MYDTIFRSRVLRRPLPMARQNSRAELKKSLRLIAPNDTAVCIENVWSELATSTLVTCGVKPLDIPKIAIVADRKRTTRRDWLRRDGTRVTPCRRQHRLRLRDRFSRLSLLESRRFRVYAVACLYVELYQSRSRRCTSEESRAERHAARKVDEGAKKATSLCSATEDTSDFFS